MATIELDDHIVPGMAGDGKKKKKKERMMMLLMTLMVMVEQVGPCFPLPPVTHGVVFRKRSRRIPAHRKPPFGIPDMRDHAKGEEWQ
jgi:hypothetical protein